MLGWKPFDPEAMERRARWIDEHALLGTVLLGCAIAVPLGAVAFLATSDLAGTVTVCLLAMVVTSPPRYWVAKHGPFSTPEKRERLRGDG